MTSLGRLALCAFLCIAASSAKAGDGMIICPAPGGYLILRMPVAPAIGKRASGWADYCITKDNVSRCDHNDAVVTAASKEYWSVQAGGRDVVIDKTDKAGVKISLGFDGPSVKAVGCHILLDFEPDMLISPHP